MYIPAGTTCRRGLLLNELFTGIFRNAILIEQQPFRPGMPKS